jgi:hypothetical protein
MMRIFYSCICGLVVISLALPAFPDALDAAALEKLFGDEWYGVYLNGQKAGYATFRFGRGAGRTYEYEEEVQLKITMSGLQQDMHMLGKRVYDDTGALVRLESRVQDPVSVSEFTAEVQGDQMHLVSKMGGDVTTQWLPKPKESLRDALKFGLWVAENQPGVGDTLTFAMFEPMYQREITATSRVAGVEQRLLDGVPTTVYRIATHYDIMNLDAESYVTADGTVLEDVLAGIMKIRLEPEHVAKDVRYSNDVIISNAVVLEEAIPDSRTRESLRLYLAGPLSGDHLFCDERQTLRRDGEQVLFEAKRISMDDWAGPTLPIQNPEVAEWTRATPFVQSDHPKILEKAREIVGDTTNAWEAAKKLNEWVRANMRSTFSARFTNALEVLENLEGDCTEHSVLFIALARAVGIPAREVAGLVYVDAGKPAFYFHQWAKVWVGKWVDMDPTFGQTTVDVTHIKLGEGDLFDLARIIPIIGRLKIHLVSEEAHNQAPASVTP